MEIAVDITGKPRRDEMAGQHGADTSERCFWSHVLQLQDDIRSILTSVSQESPVDLTTLFYAPHTRQYLIETLGVFGGSFGIAHRSSKEFKLLQWSFYGMPPGLPQLRLPYLDPQSTVDCPEDLYFMDLAFTSLRRYQPLHGRVSLHEFEYRFSPEFYSHLQPAGNNHLCITAAEKALREKGWDLLHCSHGEVALFVWAWLWIRRLASKGCRRILRLDEEVDAIPIEDTLSPWDRSFWEEVREIHFEDPPADLVFADFLQVLFSAAPNEASQERQVPPAVLASARRQWERIRNYEHRNPSNFVRALFVDASGNWTCSVKVAVDFALHLSQKKRAGIPNSEGLNFLREVERAEEDLQNTYSRLGTSEKAPKSDQVALHDALARIVVFILLANDHSELERIRSSENIQGAVTANNFSVYQALRRLHQVARFPIIHYYCLQTLYGAPLEHLVLPVWNSFKYREEVFVRDIVGNGKEAATPHVVLALLSIRPSWYRSNSSLCVDDWDSPSFERLCRVQTLMKQLASPLVDFGFYGSLVRLEQEAAGKRAASHSTPDAFAYAIEDLLQHERICRDDFTVPPLLYVAAMEAMLSARTREDLKKSAIRLISAEKIVNEIGGISTALINHLIGSDVGSSGIVRALAENRLIRDGIRSHDEVEVELVGSRAIPMPQAAEWQVWIIIGILVVLLKEAFENSIRAALRSSQRPRVRVTIDANRKAVAVSNSCDVLDVEKYNQGNQKETLERLVRQLDRQWRIVFPSIVHDGFVTTELEAIDDAGVV